MSRLPRPTGKERVRALERAGFVVERIRGSTPEQLCDLPKIVGGAQHRRRFCTKREEEPPVRRLPISHEDIESVTGLARWLSPFVHLALNYQHGVLGRL
jgi:hypothetical protein